MVKRPSAIRRSNVDVPKSRDAVLIVVSLAIGYLPSLSKAKWTAFKLAGMGGLTCAREARLTAGFVG
ncbi:hypothetical protein X962_6180 [Burkholderia pseudomallei MSHR7343]|nr:hypothetical protein X962_6180 [Burkholderia pseudomallei MSHR7343]